MSERGIKREVVIDGQAARITVHGTPRDGSPLDGQVVFERLPEAATGEVSGDAAPPNPTVASRYSVEAVGTGLYSVLLAGRSYRVTVGGRQASGATELMVNGRSMAIEVFDPRDLRAGARGTSHQGRQEITAQMPGKIVRLLVEPGDSVEAGQGLIVVEAMKMQNEMKSPKAGTVAEVRAKPGATVAAGEVLLAIE